jgi:hypothetical protein
MLRVQVEINERGRARTAQVNGRAPASLQRCIERSAMRISVSPPDTGTVTATWSLDL